MGGASSGSSGRAELRGLSPGPAGAATPSTGKLSSRTVGGSRPSPRSRPSWGPPSPRHPPPGWSESAPTPGCDGGWPLSPRCLAGGREERGALPCLSLPATGGPRDAPAWSRALAGPFAGPSRLIRGADASHKPLLEARLSPGASLHRWCTPPCSAGSEALRLCPFPVFPDPVCHLSASNASVSHPALGVSSSKALRAPSHLGGPSTQTAVPDM